MQAKKTLIGALLTGLLTGLCWSSLVALFSTDQEFDGREFLISLSVPALAAVLVWKVSGARLWMLLIVAHCTFLIPLFGLGIGGANILLMAIGGTIGGGFWILPFAIWQYVRYVRSKQPASPKIAGEPPTAEP